MAFCLALHLIMNRLFFAILFLCLLSNVKSQKFNRIDSLITAEDVENFVNNEKNKINYRLSLEDKLKYDWYCNVINDSLKPQKAWWKADFDLNGLTDLLITRNTYNGPETVYILDTGNSFELKNLSMGNLYEQCSFAIPNNNKITYYSIKILDRYGNLSKLIKQGLIYKNGSFIEENPDVQRHHILEIEFEMGGSHWINSNTKIEIVSNRDIAWTVTKDDHSHVYSSKLSKEKFKEIIDLLNYIDFENLHDEYNVSYSDAGTTHLKVTYDHLKVKTIRDYGGMGTRGLRKLYDTILALKNQ
ncbi:hypothetical protein QE422_000492 [Chryseobacterium sp. SORGH_AS 447]|nr:hypothetical protein [Chryseobacterium sp. SORGH_AS_0447]